MRVSAALSALAAAAMVDAQGLNPDLFKTVSLKHTTSVAPTTSKAVSTPKYTGPATISDRKAAIASIEAYLNDIKPTGAQSIGPSESVTAGKTTAKTTAKTTSKSSSTKTSAKTTAKTTPKAEVSSVRAHARDLSKRTVTVANGLSCDGSLIVCNTGATCVSNGFLGSTCSAGATTSTKATSTSAAAVVAGTTITAAASLSIAATASISGVTVSLPSVISIAPVSVGVSISVAGSLTLPSVTIPTITVASITIVTPTVTDLGVNGACATQPVYWGLGPLASLINTASTFLNFANFSNIAMGAPSPKFYNPIFQGFYGSLSKTGFLGVYQLNAYDPSACQALCDGVDRCLGFNIFYERDPTLSPAASCMNPTAQTAIKCTLWDTYPDPTEAINIGSWRQNFAVVISGSNAYANNRTYTPPPVVSTTSSAASTATSAVSGSGSGSGSSGSSSVSSASSGSSTTSAVPSKPTSCSGFNTPSVLTGAVSVPNSMSSKAVSSKLFSAWQPSSCASLCTSTTVLNQQNALQQLISTVLSTFFGTKTYSYTPCNFFNVYEVDVAGQFAGMYCQLYSDIAVLSYTGLTAQISGSVTYNISNSYGYSLTNQDSGSASYTFG